MFGKRGANTPQGAALEKAPSAENCAVKQVQLI